MWSERPTDTPAVASSASDNVPRPDPVPRVMLPPVAERSYVVLLNLWTVVISIFLATRV